MFSTCSYSNMVFKVRILQWWEHCSVSKFFVIISLFTGQMTIVEPSLSSVTFSIKQSMLFEIFIFNLDWQHFIGDFIISKIIKKFPKMFLIFLKMFRWWDGSFQPAGVRILPSVWELTGIPLTQSPSPSSISYFHSHF